MSRYAAIPQVVLTTLLFASWNVATTHCALSAAIAPASAPATAANTDPDECPMHAASKKAAPAPAKKKGCDDLPCCKTLPAAAAKTVIASKAPTVGAFINYISTDSEWSDRRLFAIESVALDTGPPEPSALIKIVLQRSIPAHAPPI